jgi:hypothetical protein
MPYDISAIVTDATGNRGDDARKRLECCSLARAIRADECDHFSGFDVKVDASHGGDCAVSNLESTDLKQGRRRDTLR